MSDTARGAVPVRAPSAMAAELSDMDGPLAAKTRTGYARPRGHPIACKSRPITSPFPACGHIVKSGTGYELVPAMWAPL